MASDRQGFSVVGFQYEPVRSNPNPVELYNDEDDDEVGVPSIEEIKRSANNLGEWCQCGECKPMPTERECLCCAEVDAIKYFHLIGR